MNGIDSLTKQVIDCVTINDLPKEDYCKMQTLVSKLLGDRKNLHWGIESKAITTIEAASVILSHLYTEEDGYFRVKRLVNFDVTNELSQLFNSAK